MAETTQTQRMAQACRFSCPLCAYTGSENAIFDEILQYVTDNAHKVHLNELVVHVRAALALHLQLEMSREQVREHFLTHACDQKVVLNHTLRDLVDVISVAKSTCIVTSEEGLASMDPKSTGVHLDSVKQLMLIYKQLDQLGRSKV
jgi:hypothetical protein